MDEQKLADLFRDAVRDAPPPSFDEGDVRTASRRATARRRNSIAAGTSLVVVLGFGGVFAGTNWFGIEDEASLGSAESGQQGNAQDPGVFTAQEPPPAQNDTKSIPGTTPTQGGVASPGSTGPEAGDRAAQGCAAVDLKLADALAVELQVPADAAEPPTVTCSPDSRSVMFKIDGLTLTAILTPQSFDAPAGAAKVKAGQSGQDLYVFTTGDGELKGRAGEIAEKLAPKV